MDSPFSEPKDTRFDIRAQVGPAGSPWHNSMRQTGRVGSPMPFRRPPWPGTNEPRWHHAPGVSVETLRLGPRAGRLRDRVGDGGALAWQRPVFGLDQRRGDGGQARFWSEAQVTSPLWGFQEWFGRSA